MAKLVSFQILHAGVKLFFGIDSVWNIRDYLRGFKKLLIVTGRRSAKVSGALDDVLKILNEYGIEYIVYDRVRPNPTVDIVHGIVNEYRDSGAEGIIAIGGGSVIDSAKAARVVIAGGGNIVDYVYGLKEIPEKQVFLLAINLTHGTGTEIDRYAVVNIPEKKEKRGFSPGYPSISVDDPRYTRSLPRSQTIYTSIDAFAHSVESSTTTRANPFVWLLSGEAIRNIIEYLPRALRDPSDLTARYWLLYASMIAGISIDYAVTHLGHALEHFFSGLNPELPHGAGLAILYRKLLGFFYRINPEVMSKLLKPLNKDLKPVPEDGVLAEKSYNEFLERIGFEEKLSDYGFGLDDVREAVREMYEGDTANWLRIIMPVMPGRDELYEWLASLI
jgi:alcohol dehydrogenase